jgi:hypothetical protein
MTTSPEDDRLDDDETVDLVIDLRSPTQSAAGVFAVSVGGSATRLPLRADEYRQLVGTESS